MYIKQLKGNEVFVKPVGDGYLVSDEIINDERIITTSSNFLKAKRFSLKEVLEYYLSKMTAEELDELKGIYDKGEHSYNTILYDLAYHNTYNSFKLVTVETLDYNYDKKDTTREYELIKQFGFDKKYFPEVITKELEEEPTPNTEEE